MKLIDASEIPHRKLYDEERIAEIEAFLESGGMLCEVERYTKDLSTDYNRYKNLLWRMGLAKEIRVFTRMGRCFLQKLNGDGSGNEGRK